MKKITILFLLLLSLIAHADCECPYQKLFQAVGIPDHLSPAELVLETQRIWTQKDKERWEFDQRYEPMKETLWPIFDQMGLLKKVEPKRKHYKYALVFGALLKAVEKRVGYLEQLIDSGVEFDQIVFLSGARTLLQSERIATRLDTEREMVEWVYERSRIPKSIPVVFINAPMKQIAGVWRRPQTTDTIKEWLKTDPMQGNVLAISSQPYVSYQNAVLAYFLPQEFEGETVGSAITDSPKVSVILDAVAMELFWRNSK